MSDLAADKETREALVAVNEIALEIVKVIKGGALMADIAILLGDLAADSPFKTAVAAGIDGLLKVSGEFGSMGLPGYADLVETQIGYLPKILAAFKAPAAPASV